MKLEQQTTTATPPSSSSGAATTISIPVLLDCCTIVSAIDGRPDTLAFRNKLSRRNNVTLIVPDIAVSEVARVARMTAEAAEEAIGSFSKGKKVIRVSDDDILVEAVALTLRYDYCHYPDSIYLVQCKKTGAVLVTYDKKLREVAGMEGVMACSPDHIRFYQ